MFLSSKSIVLMMKRSYTLQGLALQGLFSGVCCMHCAVVFWLLYALGQLSLKALLACSGQCFVLGWNVIFNEVCSILVVK